MLPLMCHPTCLDWPIVSWQCLFVQNTLSSSVDQETHHTAAAEISIQTLHQSPGLWQQSFTRLCYHHRVECAETGQCTKPQHVHTMNPAKSGQLK